MNKYTFKVDMYTDADGNESDTLPAWLNDIRITTYGEDIQEGLSRAYEELEDFVFLYSTPIIDSWTITLQAISIERIVGR